MSSSDTDPDTEKEHSYGSDAEKQHTSCPDTEEDELPDEGQIIFFSDKRWWSDDCMEGHWVVTAVDRDGMLHLEQLRRVESTRRPLIAFQRTGVYHKARRHKEALLPYAQYKMGHRSNENGLYSFLALSPEVEHCYILDQAEVH